MKKDLPIYQSGLISALRNGDEKSFRIIFEHFYPSLYNFSYRFLKNKEKSQEVVQETFIKLWLNRENLNEQYPVAPYLYTITRRLTLNALRQATTSQAAMKSLWEHVQKAHNETEEKILLHDLDNFTEKAVTQLPKQQQTVFRMSREDELSYDEIAGKLQISRNTVKNHLIAALKTLRSHFNKAYINLFF